MLIHAGDFSNVGLPKDVTALSEWLARLPYKHKIVIAGIHRLIFHHASSKKCSNSFHATKGNHDLTFDPISYPMTWQRFGHPEQYDCNEVKSLLKNCTYLEGPLPSLLSLISFSPYQSDELVEIEGIKIYGSPWQPELCSWAFNLTRYGCSMELSYTLRFQSRVNTGEQNVLRNGR